MRKQKRLVKHVGGWSIDIFKGVATGFIKTKIKNHTDIDT